MRPVWIYFTEEKIEKGDDSPDGTLDDWHFKRIHLVPSPHNVWESNCRFESVVRMNENPNCNQIFGFNKCNGIIKVNIWLPADKYLFFVF